MNEDLFKEIFEQWWNDDPEDPDPDDVKVELFETKAEYREMFHTFLSTYLEKSRPETVSKNLLKRYMTNVANAEGLYFIDDKGKSVWGPDSSDNVKRLYPELSDQDHEILVKLAREIEDYCRE